jgi:hypothetical protein
MTLIFNLDAILAKEFMGKDKTLASAMNIAAATVDKPRYMSNAQAQRNSRPDKEPRSPTPALARANRRSYPALLKLTWKVWSSPSRPAAAAIAVGASRNPPCRTLYPARWGSGAETMATAKKQQQRTDQKNEGAVTAACNCCRD